MIRTKGILHFTLPVTDLDRSTAFFADLLGCKVLTRSPTMSFLQSGDDYFILARSETPIRPNVEGQTRVHHAFMVDHDAIGGAKKFLTDNGVEILRDEYRTEGAFTGRQFYFHDPDGNVIELIAFDGLGPGF